MATERAERRLAAIMFTDIVGYTALMAESEETGLQVRKRHRALVRSLASNRPSMRATAGCPSSRPSL